MQFDEDSRVFSFQKEGPLDMRMDSTAPVTAFDVVNKCSEGELGSMLRDLGEERLWRKGAKAIVEARKKKTILTTKDLSNVIEKSIRRVGKTHPATKIFQAIRIYVNKELETIEGSIKKAIHLLAPGGKVGVLSFHSLEDRIVKNVFRAAALPTKNLNGKVLSESVIENLTKKPICPTRKEIKINRRSRSAKLRFAKKK